eukprot:Nitzschia sp. Nitz4//scaffold113_size70149//15291//16223//NITZ4_005943-RA/size70149-augustus-gene-0.89-mRNA-1//-1//CDS//3329533320//4132//frame0
MNGQQHHHNPIITSHYRGECKPTLWMNTETSRTLIPSFLYKITTLVFLAMMIGSTSHRTVSAFLRPIVPAIWGRVSYQHVSSPLLQRQVYRSSSVMVRSASLECLFARNTQFDSSIAPTWTYKPFNATAAKLKKGSNQTRQASKWNVPTSIDIPEEKISFTFARSSGAGGQNVNKVNTKAELRFKVDKADWIPEEVRDRLKEQNANRLSKDGFLTIQSQEHRTQLKNRKSALNKLKVMLLQAWPRPKEREMREGISEVSKAKNIEYKRRRSEVKKNRRRIDDW